MAATPESASPDSENAVIEGLLQASYSTAGIENYRPCLRALIQIVPNNSPRLLAAAAVNLELVTQVVPWALQDWAQYYPALHDLTRVYRLLPGGPTHHEIPHEGIKGYPVLAGLRRNTLKHPKDDFVRALLISLAVRIPLDPDLAPAERSAKQSEHACIDVLKRFIRSLNDKRSHKKRGPWLDRAAKQDDSPKNFLVALAQTVLSAKNPGEELRDALAIEAMQVFGLQPLAIKREPGGGSGVEPSLPNVTSSPIEDEDAEEPKGPHPGSVSIRQVRIPIPDPDDPSPEAQDEAQQTTFYARRNRPSRKPPGFTELREAIRRPMRAQNIPSAGDLFLKPHIDTLSGAEGELVAKTLVQKATDALDDQDLQTATSFALLALILSTGFTPDRAVALLQRDASGEPPFIDGNRLTLKSMLPDSAFHPESEAEPLLRSESKFSVDLPPSVAKLLARVRLPLTQSLEGANRDGRLAGAIAKIRKATGIRYLSTSRIRRTYAVLIHEASNDYCPTATLSQDFFRQSPAPLHYYSARSDVLAGIYNRAIWPVFGEEPDLGTIHESVRVGTQAAAEPTALKSAAKAASKPLHATTDRDDPASVARTHNAMVAHIADMIIAIVGHRHSSALFTLRRWDFDLELGAANIADKMSDPAHLRRLVGLGSQVARQIGLYLLHLDEATKLRGMRAFSHRAETARKGQSGLFFRLDDDGQPQEGDLGWLKRQRGEFPEIPTNWGRHHLGSAGRELTDVPNLIGIQLGHYESTGYVFSPDSPTIPGQFVRLVNPLLDQVFHRQNWRLHTGLARSRLETRQGLPAKGEDSWVRTGPMVDWEHANQEFARQAKKRNLLVRRSRWAKQHQIRHATEQAVVTIAASFDTELADILAYRINERQQIQKKQDAQYVTLPGHGIRKPDRLPKRVERADRVVEEIFSAIGEEFSEPEAAILAHNTVANALIWASRQNLYQGPIHWPWMPLRPLDISPFTPGIFRACVQSRSLREHFEQLGHAPVSGRIPSREHAAGTAALALAVFGGIDDENLLEELITGDCAVYRVPAISDAIVVHSRHLKHTSGFRGIAALAYLAWRRTAQSLEEMPELKESLIQALPTKAYSARTNVVRALCSTVSMTNRIERSGMANYALNIDNGCTCLDEDQLAQLLGSECEVLPQATDENAVFYGPKVEDSDLPEPQGFDLRAEYEYLKNMYRKSEDVQLYYSGHLWRYDYPNTKRERNKLVEEALLVGRNENWSWFGRYWGNWIASELTRPKFADPKNLLAYSTVFGGFKEVANRMRKLLSKRSEKHLQRAPNTDFLEELYELILEDAPASTQQRICRTILRFHERVALDTGIDDVDASNYWGYWRPRRWERAEVRTWLPMTSDLKSVESALLGYAETDSTLNKLGNIDRRLIREALLAYRLAMASGARIGEITGLKTTDILLIGEEAGIFIRPNRQRPLKTRAARRVIDISEQFPPELHPTLSDHIAAERANQPKRQRDQTWLFSDLSARPVPAEQHRRLVNQATRVVLGHDFRWHALRHRWVCRLIVYLTLGVQLDSLSIAVDSPGKANIDLPNRETGTPDTGILQKLQLPRDAARISAQIGHSRIRTTLLTYYHLPWSFQLQHSPTEPSGKPRAERVAGALGISRSAAYRRLSGSNSSEARLVASEITSFFGARHAPSLGNEPVPHVYLSAAQRDPRLCLGLHAIGQGVPTDQILYRPGLTPTEIERLRQSDLESAAQTSIGFFPDNPHAARRFSRPPRWPTSSRKLQTLWAALEMGNDLEIIRLSEVWRMSNQRGLRHGLRLKREPRRILIWAKNDLTLLQAQLRPLGIRIRIAEESSTHVALSAQTGARRNVTSELAWVLSISDVIHRARKSAEIG